MKLVIYFLNFAFSKSLNGTESETRDIANVHDEYYEVHEKMQNDMLSNVEHMMNKRSLLNKRFEPYVNSIIKLEDAASWYHVINGNCTTEEASIAFKNFCQM